MNQLDPDLVIVLWSSGGPYLAYLDIGAARPLSADEAWDVLLTLKNRPEELKKQHEAAQARIRAARGRNATESE